MAGRKAVDKPGTHSQVDAILDAAEAVVLRDGMGRLTLEAVAKRAGLSKAGLLHHIASKDAMITAMVERQISQWQQEFQRVFEGQCEAGVKCPAVSSMMGTCMAGTEKWTESERARNRVLVAALVHDERQVEPMRKVHRQMERMLAKDGLEPGVADTIHLAIHGLWFQWIFGMGDVSASRLRAIRGVLRSLGKLDPVDGKTPARGRVTKGAVPRRGANGVGGTKKAGAGRLDGSRNFDARGGH